MKPIYPPPLPQVSRTVPRVPDVFERRRVLEGLRRLSESLATGKPIPVPETTIVEAAERFRKAIVDDDRGRPREEPMQASDDLDESRGFR